MRMLFRLVLASLLITTASSLPGADGAVDFAKQIGPLLESRCIRCHEPNNAKGDLSLATRASLIGSGFVEPGRPDQSALLNAVTGTDGNPPTMPKDGEPLTAAEVSLLRRWIAAGANWPESIVLREKPKGDASWWSLQPVSDVAPPQTGHPIDAFVRAKLAAERLEPLPQADRRTQIRRLYFDLLGLPPSPEAVQEFVADDDPRAYDRLVDQLLDSPHFGERWARHWLDIAHYADTHGFERDKRRDNAWPYRDYVIRSFNDDKPYDQFLREQIAGDVLAPQDEEAIIATGFLSAGPWDFVGQVETKSGELRRSARALDLDDMVTQVLTSTMAVTINCARCHEHKLDPITQAEYYQLVSNFAGLKRGDREISPAATKKYNAEKQRLNEAIGQTAFAIAELEGKGVDLADVVGGGNGFGTGRKGLGLDARSGKVQERPFGDLGNVKPGDYRACEYEFVDGVFVPANGETKISSTGLTAKELPENSGKAWDMIRNGPVASQFSSKLGETDFNADGHSMIGLHANAGITFDLREIRKATNYGELTFSTVVGYGGQPVEPSAEFRVLLDGQQLAHGRIGRNDAVPIKFSVPEDARFLTFISTDGGNGYGHDQISFGDPRLAPAKLRNLTDDDRKQLAELRAQKTQLEAELKQLGEPPVFYGVIAEQPPTVHVLQRGDPETPGDGVVPGTLSWSDKPLTFGSADMPEGDRRVALANWITDPQNPLTARVIVNRLWHWHFGQGLVTTPSDFGYGGDRPSHPELLDWLAAELMRNKWSLKHIHRLIVTSDAYRMRSAELGMRNESQQPSGAAAKTSRDAFPHSELRIPHLVDSDNRLLWRMNPRRLEAEAVRDAVLSVTGKLNPEMYGPGYRDFDYEEAYAPVYEYRTADTPDVWRRSVYRFLVRTTPQQFMTVLDCPDPANMTPKRNVTTTALQSLALFNNDFMLRQAGYFAERLEHECPGDEPAQIARAFDLAFAREPDSGELDAARQLVNQHGLLHLCRALFNASEFVVVD
jgi:hypothetical protein